ncbi:hypothetical protein B0T21DRAFT_353994, partial [Apiosordaria backusii]
TNSHRTNHGPLFPLLQLTPSNPWGDGQGGSISDRDSLHEACPSSTRYLPRHNLDINHNLKAKHPQHPFKWSTRRLRTINQHWFWSGNYYRAHHDPSKQGPFRIKPHQARAILNNKAIGTKRAGVEPFVRTWANRDSIRRRRQHEQRSWKELADAGLEDQDDEEVQLPFERERERSERRQQRRRPPSLERQDAFRDERTSKKRREMMRKADLTWAYYYACGAMVTGQEYDADEKIRVVGHDQGVYEKDIYEAAARVVHDSGTEELDWEYGRELIDQARFRIQTKRFRGRRVPTCKQEERVGQVFASDMRLEFSTLGVNEALAALIYSSQEGIGDRDVHMQEAPLLRIVYEAADTTDEEEDNEWELLDGFRASDDDTPPSRETAVVTTEDDLIPWVLILPSP